jgi:hypothetical protein
MLNLKSVQVKLFHKQNEIIDLTSKRIQTKNYGGNNSFRNTPIGLLYHAFHQAEKTKDS